VESGERVELARSDTRAVHQEKALGYVVLGRQNLGRTTRGSPVGKSPLWYPLVATCHGLVAPGSA
jgi:hypothetical protein